MSNIMRLLYYLATLLWPSGFSARLLRIPEVLKGFLGVSLQIERQVGKALRPSILIHPEPSFHLFCIVGFLVQFFTCGIFTSGSK